MSNCLFSYCVLRKWQVPESSQDWLVFCRCTTQGSPSRSHLDSDFDILHRRLPFHDLMCSTPLDKAMAAIYCRDAYHIVVIWWGGKQTG